MIPLRGDHQSIGDAMKKEAKNLGNRRVGKIGIIIGNDPDKKILSHQVLCNYVGDSIPLFQDETGYFVLHSEEKVYLYNDKNIGHLVKDRSNISDQKDRPNFTSIRDRMLWDLNHPLPVQSTEEIV
jgi:hypothetical protein